MSTSLNMPPKSIDAFSNGYNQGQMILYAIMNLVESSLALNLYSMHFRSVGPIK